MTNESKGWAAQINPQPMFDILAKANAKEMSGHYVARMEIGDTPGFRNVEIEELLKKYSSTPHRYSPSRGEQVLIDVLFKKEWPNMDSRHNGISIAPANFLIMASLASITSPGDVVLIPDPGFPTYELVCKFLKLKIKRYNALPTNGELEISNSNFLLEDKPKVIIINNPSNPIGLAYDGKHISSFLHSIVNSEVKVIIDETYVNLVYDDVDAYIPDIDAIRIRTFSKEYCAPGLRIGYCLASNAISQKISDFISLTISCSPKFIQLAVAEYLESSESRNFNAGLKKEMIRRFKLLKEIMPTNALLTDPNAGFYALIKTGNAERAFDFFLEKNVSTCPGTRFGNSTNEALRISIAGSSNNIEKDFMLLKNAFMAWQN
jgi:aspartate/methionine/tyrosine aminotransferase